MKSIGIGICIGLLVGGAITWYLTRDFTNQAVVEAELKFNELLEEEKTKLSGEISTLKKSKEDLKALLGNTKQVVDSLNASIISRNKDLEQLKDKYNDQISNIYGMSHNELTDFFANRYK